MDKIEIIEVKSRAQSREFINFAKWLYQDNPLWITPLDSSIEAIFSPQHNPLFTHGSARRWLAHNHQGECVGRIAAFYTSTTPNQDGERVAGCGFFESVDSTVVANALFTKAQEWLSSLGFEAMDGAINFGSRAAWWGVLTKGFEYTPLFENNYNPPYYPRLFEEFGFKCYFNQYSYRWRVGIESTNPNIDSRSQRAFKQGGYSVKRVKPSQLDEATKWFTEIYNDSWSSFPDIEPITLSQAQRVISSLRPIIDYRLILFAFHGEKAVGFIVMIPDINRLIHDFNGKLTLYNKLRLWWRLHIRRSCDRAFGMVFGVAKAHQGRGVESAIITTLRDEYILTPKNRAYKSCEFAWIGDFNPVMCRVMERYIGAERHKQHTTYRLYFNQECEFRRAPTIKHNRD